MSILSLIGTANFAFLGLSKPTVYKIHVIKSEEDNYLPSVSKTVAFERLSCAYRPDNVTKVQFLNEKKLRRSSNDTFRNMILRMVV